MVALLHNIRSLHNVGSIFRTADAAGVSKLFLSGYTPAPVDRLGHVRQEIKKTALGAEKIIPWEKVTNPKSFLDRMKRAGYLIVAVEDTKNAEDYRVFKVHSPVLLIMGNEARGISSSIINQCDAVVKLPMRGAKESLNVAVAFGIMVYKATEGWV